MSEFTSGNILLSEAREVVRAHARKGSGIVQLNDKFIAYITEDIYIDEQVPGYIVELSRETPVLYFYNFGDHHWGYRLLVQGKEEASIHISYEFEEEITYEIAEERYPDKAFDELFSDGFMEELREELVANAIFEERFEATLNHCHPELFSLLNASEEQIVRLREIFNTEYIHHDIDEGMELVEEFKSILGIEEMIYRNDRISDDGDYDELL